MAAPAGAAPIRTAISHAISLIPMPSRTNCEFGQGSQCRGSAELPRHDQDGPAQLERNGVTTPSRMPTRLTNWASTTVGRPSSYRYSRPEDHALPRVVGRVCDITLFGRQDARTLLYHIKGAASKLTNEIFTLPYEMRRAPRGDGSAGSRARGWTCTYIHQKER